MVKKVIFILIFILALTGLLLCIPTEENNSWDFKHSIWGPANLLVHSQAPYQLNPPYGPYIAPWWPQIIGATFWMGWLSFELASKIWLAIEITGIGFSIWLLNDRRKLLLHQFGLIILFIFLFPPIYTHIHLGQFSLFFVSLMLILVFSKNDFTLSNRSLLWAALFIILGAAKPQLTILIYPGILAAVFKNRGWRGAFRLVTTSSIFLGVFLIPLFIFYPDWFCGFLETTQHNLNAGWALPTPFFQLTFHFGSKGVFLWILLYISALIFSLYIWLKRGAREGMLWSMALTPLVTAYCSTWDFILLLPLFFWLFLHFKNTWSQIGLLTGMLMIDIWQIIPRFGKTNVPEHKQWWVPVVLLVVFILSMQIEKWKAPFSLAAMPARKKPEAKKLPGSPR